MLIPLVINNIQKLHKGRVWECWNHTGGRCGRWSVLLQLRTIAAHSHPDKLQPYSPPRPYVVTYRPDGPGNSMQAHHVDPEDSPLIGSAEWSARVVAG